MVRPLLAIALLLSLATAQIAEYHTFGDVAAVRTIHEEASIDFMAIVTNATGVGFEPFRIILYDPVGMTDDEVASAIQNACSYASVCPTAAEVRDGNLCGGVCGTPPLLVMKVDDYNRGDRAFVQESAVHEVNHIFQIQNTAPQFKTDSGDAGEDWRGMGPRWWGEGSATWLGDRVLRAYPGMYEQPNAQRTNFGRTIDESCAAFKATEEQRSLRLTDAIQASDEPWQKLWVEFDMTYNGISLGQQNAYYPMVYEGGYCACDYMLSLMGLDTQTLAGMSRGIELLLQVEATTKTKGSWETAFLDAFNAHFSSMQDFYEKFEAAHGTNGTYTYVAPVPPSGCDDSGCSTPDANMASNMAPVFASMITAVAVLRA